MDQDLTFLRNVLKLTSKEQPINEDLSKAFSNILKRFGGAASNSYISVTPPVKSSMASHVEPPFKASYDPCNLEKDT